MLSGQIVQHEVRPSALTEQDRTSHAVKLPQIADPEGVGRGEHLQGPDRRIQFPIDSGRERPRVVLEADFCDPAHLGVVEDDEHHSQDEDRQESPEHDQGEVGPEFQRQFPSLDGTLGRELPQRT